MSQANEILERENLKCNNLIKEKEEHIRALKNEVSRRFRKQWIEEYNKNYEAHYERREGSQQAGVVPAPLDVTAASSLSCVYDIFKNIIIYNSHI